MAEYTDASIVEITARQIVIPRHEELAICLEPNIKYLFKIARKSNELGKCSPATGKWRYLTDYDYVIEIWKEGWDYLTAHQQEALIYHELRHIKKVEKEKEDGTVEVKWRTAKHPYEFFLRELTHYGAWNEQLRLLFEAIQRDERKYDDNSRNTN